jgi:very-short-patch-repair endonuclease
VVELDGYDFHDGREQFEIDRDRDADLLTAGIATVRVTSERVKLKPAREAARLHAILASRAPGG